MSRKLLFFINPISGNGKNASIAALIHAKMQSAKLDYVIQDTRRDGRYDFLPELIRAEGFTDVIVCGGDGSINQVGAYLLDLPVQTGIIPLGSGNGLALAAGISRKPQKALDIIIAGHASRIDAFRINGRFSCMLCGLGFDAQVAHDFARQSTRGLSTYVVQTIRNFFKSPDYPFTVIVGNTHIQTRAFFISIANSNQFGNHVTIAPKASLSDGLLDVVMVKKTNRLLMVFSLLRQIRYGRLQETIGDEYSKKQVQYFQASELQIRNPELAPLHIDGEAVPTESSFSFHVIPSALNLIRPA